MNIGDFSMQSVLFFVVIDMSGVDNRFILDLEKDYDGSWGRLIFFSCVLAQVFRVRNKNFFSFMPR